MKILLRSTFLAKSTDNEELFKQNFMALRASGLGFEIAEDAHIWEYVCHFVETHSHVPKLQTIRQNFERSKEMEIVDRLAILQTAAPLTRGDFIKRMEDLSEDRRSRDIKELLKDTATVLEQGLEIKRGRETVQRKGSFDAIHHFLENSHGIAVPATGQQLSGIANKDGEGFWEEYERVQREGGAKGFPCGIDQIDDKMVGAKKFELWIHAAFAGHMKSTFALNWAYNLAVYHWHSSLYFSLEMPYKQVRNFLYALHTFHEKFRDLRIKYGIQKAPQKAPGKVKKDGKNTDVGVDTNDNGLSYTKIRDAKLSPDERKFLEVVVDDFENCAEYGDIHVEVPNPEKDDTTIIDIKARAEVINAATPFSVLFIDHLLLVSARKWVSNTSERLNEVVRDTKKLAMNFNRGSGMAVVALFQINREGFRAAEKAGGKYNMTHLSYANEAERSADVISASWLTDELRKASVLFMQCLKSRDQAPFEDFYASFVSEPRRLITNLNAPEDITKQTTPAEKKKEALDMIQQEDVGNLIDEMTG